MVFEINLQVDARGLNLKVMSESERARAALYRRRRVINAVAITLAVAAALFGLAFLGWILWTLLEAERSVNEIVQILDKPQSAVSQHLAKLRLARLVLPRRHGAQVFYRVANDHVRQLVADALHHAEHAGPGVPAHHRGEAAVLPAREAR